MTAATDEFAIRKNAEPIPGYRLEERIGVGGYGEVWKASAPGGLTKAVKIIHGTADGKLAIRELRSLDRVKKLSHPFLLSLERIEIVDGHLIIVTELADATLKDRFEQCRAQGLPGIPRAELLEYMRQAADALDYLFEKHSLQHLDIKPENLLLIGDHVKVADFGLMKNLQESCASLVTGLTPKYSSPEMFEGKPGPHSDQYSLAVMYQELLTGQLPFNGSSIASLASQHLNCVPDLSPLNPLERFAIGKSLAKDAQHRFPNCRALVDRLMHRSSAVITAGISDGAHPRVEERPSQDGPSHVHDGCTVQVVAPDIRSLPRLCLAAGATTFRPAVFIGIGGTGGSVISRLRQLMTDRIGEVDALPALSFLYIDTDADSVQSFAAGPWNDGLRPDEILITPLRQTQDYRSSPVSSLNSISRRWIYNVPRSLRTHGLRALGRIALLDHADRLLDRLRRAIRCCTDHQSVATTAAKTGLPFRDLDPRVFVVASIAGGTGSGMVIDAAYAIRQVLAECGLADEDMSGILTYATQRGSATNSFAPPNAYACLEELRYFGQPGCDYPGEPACGLAGFSEDGPTFRSTYLFDFGDDLTTDEAADVVDQLAEYLYFNSVSTASTLFDECRRLELETPTSQPLRLRSAGLCTLAGAMREDPVLLAERLCRCVIRKWKVGIESATMDDQIKLTDIGRLFEICNPQYDASEPIAESARGLFTEMGLSIDGLRERISSLVRDRLGADPSLYIRNLVRDSLSKTFSDKSQQASSVDIALNQINAVIGWNEEGARQSGNTIESLAEILLNQASAIGIKVGESVATWVLQHVDATNARIDGARKAAKWAADHLDALLQTLSEQSTVAKQDLAMSRDEITELQAQMTQRRLRNSFKETVSTALQTYSERLLRVLIQDGMGKSLRAARAVVSSSADQVNELWKELSQFSDVFLDTSSGASIDAGQNTGASPQRDSPRMREVYMKRQTELIEQLDQAVDRQFFRLHPQLTKILANSDLRGNLAALMRANARKIILRACFDEGHAFVKDVLAKGGDDRELSELLNRCIQDATPRLLALGGAKRLILVVPNELDAEQLRKEVERISFDEANVIIEKGGDLKLSFEIEDIPWRSVQTRLIRQRHDCQEIAQRLHTRINLDWRM
jgi:serine/threonine protein kinase